MKKKMKNSKLMSLINLFTKLICLKKQLFSLVIKSYLQLVIKLDGNNLQSKKELKNRKDQEWCIVKLQKTGFLDMGYYFLK